MHIIGYEAPAIVKDTLYDPDTVYTSFFKPLSLHFGRMIDWRTIISGNDDPQVNDLHTPQFHVSCSKGTFQVQIASLRKVLDPHLSICTLTDITSVRCMTEYYRRRYLSLYGLTWNDVKSQADMGNEYFHQRLSSNIPSKFLDFARFLMQICNVKRHQLKPKCSVRTWILFNALAQNQLGYKSEYLCEIISPGKKPNHAQTSLSQTVGILSYFIDEYNQTKSVNHITLLNEIGYKQLFVCN